jgi:pimeloyl-ACP methyl ester carboxylesterase
MAVWQWGDAEAAHLVVCVHGLSRQGRDFDVLATALLGRATVPLRIVCPDVVGRGQSEWLPDPSHYQLATYAADMLVMLDWLHAQAPVRQLDWVGTSMGGLIGMAVAGTPGLPLPAPLRRLVLNDVGPAIEWQALGRIGGYLGKAGVYASEADAAAALWQISAGFGPHTAAQWQALCAPMLKRTPTGGFGLHYDPAIAVPFRSLSEEAAAQGQAALWGLYDAIAADTLLLRGEQSDLLSQATAQAMTCRGPRARLVEFAQVGHAPTLVSGDQVEVVGTFLLAEQA